MNSNKTKDPEAIKVIRDYHHWLRNQKPIHATWVLLAAFIFSINPEKLAAELIKADAITHFINFSKDSSKHEKAIKNALKILILLTSTNQGRSFFRQSYTNAFSSINAVARKGDTSPKTRKWAEQLIVGLSSREETDSKLMRFTQGALSDRQALAGAGETGNIMALLETQDKSSILFGLENLSQLSQAGYNNLIPISLKGDARRKTALLQSIDQQHKLTEEFSETLRNLLTHQDLEIVAAAADTIAMLSTLEHNKKLLKRGQTVKHLLELSKKSNDPCVIANATNTLFQLSHSDSMIQATLRNDNIQDHLLSLSTHENPEVKSCALHGINSIITQEILPPDNRESFVSKLIGIMSDIGLERNKRIAASQVLEKLSTIPSMQAYVFSDDSIQDLCYARQSNISEIATTCGNILKTLEKKKGTHLLPTVSFMKRLHTDLTNKIKSRSKKCNPL